MNISVLSEELDNFIIAQEGYIAWRNELLEKFINDFTRIEGKDALLISFLPSGPYSEHSYIRDEVNPNIIYVRYFGQKNSPQFDNLIVDDKRPKFLSMRKPTKKYYIESGLINFFGDYINLSEYSCFGCIINITPLRNRNRNSSVDPNRQPEYQLTIDMSIIPQQIIDDRLENISKVFTAHIKAVFMLQNGFIPINSKIDEGIVKCKIIGTNR